MRFSVVVAAVLSALFMGSILIAIAPSAQSGTCETRCKNDGNSSQCGPKCRKK